MHFWWIIICTDYKFIENNYFWHNSVIVIYLWMSGFCCFMWWHKSCVLQISGILNLCEFINQVFSKVRILSYKATFSLPKGDLLTQVWLYHWCCFFLFQIVIFFFWYCFHCLIYYLSFSHYYVVLTPLNQWWKNL